MIVGRKCKVSVIGCQEEELKRSFLSTNGTKHITCHTCQINGVMSDGFLIQSQIRPLFSNFDIVLNFKLGSLRMTERRVITKEMNQQLTPYRST